METTMNIRDVHKKLSMIPEILEKKGEILVIKNSKPAFKITTLKSRRDKKYGIKDLEKLQFSGKDQKMSANIDEYSYF